jgi:hypothetical protein
MTFPFPTFCGALVAQVTTVSNHTEVTSTGSTITIPATVQAGDLLLLWDVAVAGTTPSEVVPGTFTRITANTLNVQGGGSGVRGVASYRIAVSGDESDVVTGMNGSGSNQKVLVVFRGDNPITAVNISGTVGSEGTTGNPASQNAAASGGQVPLIVVGCYGSTGAISPRTFSPAETEEITASIRCYLKYKLYDSAPSDTSVDMDDEGANILASFYIEAS